MPRASSLLTMRSPRAAWLLLMFAFIAALAHVCALPGHSHADGASPHSHHDERAPSDTGDGDAMHAASCDSLQPPARSANPEPAVALSPHAELVSVWLPRLVRNAVIVRPTSSPPLFLLHRSLLI